EEAYSLAILFDQEGLGDSCHLLATDISQKALSRAREAVYGDWSLRGENNTAALPYLIPNNPQAPRRVFEAAGFAPERNGKADIYRVIERIRGRAIFQPLNLALDTYPSFANGTWGMDLILCRNVLIYFDRETVRRVAERLYRTLADGGWLVTAA